jgi:hypothetical protein
MPDIIMDGVAYHDRQSLPDPAALMFYDGEGNECGGLVFGSGTGADGHHTQSLSLTFDAYQQDHISQLISVEEDGRRRYGLLFVDRPHTPFGDVTARLQQIRAMPAGSAQRMAWARLVATQEVVRGFFGRPEDGTVEIALYDGNKRPRLRVTVGLEGDPALEFLDAAGRVTYRLAPESTEPGGDASTEGAEGGSV